MPGASDAPALWSSERVAVPFALHDRKGLRHAPEDVKRGLCLNPQLVAVIELLHWAPEDRFRDFRFQQRSTRSFTHWRLTYTRHSYILPLGYLTI